MTTDTAAPAASTERPNKVTITDAGPSRKKIAIEIPAETVAEQLGSSLDTIQIEVDLPGFRRGRAPRRLIEKKFGSTVRREAKNQLVATAYSRAVEENKLRVIGEPTSEMLPKIELEDGKPLAFELEVEVLPEFELPSLEGIAVRKPTIEVTDEMVSKELATLGQHEGELESRDHPEPGDYLTGHAKMVDSEETSHLDIADAVVQIPGAERHGKGMILGIFVDDFADQLGSPKVGETATIKTSGPDAHETEAIRGKDLTITFRVARIDRIIPASTQALADRFGMQNEAELRDAIKGRIKQRVGIEQQSVMRQQVAQHLLGVVKMDLPERVTANQATRNLARRRLELMHRGVEAQKIEEHIAELRASSADVAVRELKLFFIMDKAAEALDVKVGEAEINGRIAQMAESRSMRPEKLRQELIQRDQVGAVFQQIREHKTMDAILAKAKVSEMSAEEFNKTMAEEGKGASAHTGGASRTSGTSGKAGGSGAKKAAPEARAEEPESTAKPAKVEKSGKADKPEKAEKGHKGPKTTTRKTPKKP
jgi:trigger factor